jgi:hypothetical protein
MCGMRAILMVAVLTMAGCPGGDDDAHGPDGSEAPLFCVPSVGPGDEPAGDGTPPLGDSPIIVTCLSGCDHPAPPAMLAADHIAFEQTGPDRLDAIVTLSRDGQATEMLSVSKERGCWVDVASIDGCRSTFHICDSGGRPFSTRIAMRTAAGDGGVAPDVVMEFR